MSDFEVCQVGQVARLQAELAAAESFHRVAVAERNHERATVAQLRAELASKTERVKWFEDAGGVAMATRFFQVEAERDALRADSRELADAQTQMIENNKKLRAELAECQEARMKLSDDLAFLKHADADEIIEAKRDAERYRWMRVRCARKGYNLSFTYAAGGEPTDWKPLSGKECDSAIDAALKEGK